MKETARTLVFLAVAGVSVAAAAAAHWFSRPQPLDGFDKVGKEFFADFTDPNAPKALKVVAYDEDTATVRDFEVKYENGVWRIPSRHNYPADGRDRLVNTSASVIGISRGALASRREADHETYGVVDPLSEDGSILKGRGQRITLTAEDGSVLADYIIGRKVDGRDGYFYVRHPREKETYITQININLSTRFADWIEADLLKLDRNELVEIVVDKYSIDETRGAIVDKEVSRLTRAPGGSSASDWQLEGLDEETEELNEKAVRDLLANLDDLRIVGVRPKPQGINADLTVSQQVARNPLLLNALRDDLADKGFLVGAGEDGNPRLYSKEGELLAATEQGVQYMLHFGQVFTGSEHEIEVGFGPDGEAAQPDGEESADAEQTSPGPSASEQRKRSRYLFVTAHLDEKHLGAKPQQPEKPAPPAESPQDADDAPAEEASQDDAGGEEAQPDGAGEQPDADQETETAAEDKQQEEKSPEQPPYEAALTEYEREVEKYENDLKLYEDKRKQGDEKVKALNKRFGEWYYVISAESFETLRLARQDLVTPKEKSDEPTEPAFPESPEDSPATESPAEATDD